MYIDANKNACVPRTIYTTATIASNNIFKIDNLNQDNIYKDPVIYLCAYLI